MRYTRLVAIVLLAAYLPACATYSVMPDPASTLKAPQTQLQQVRVTLRSGEQFNLRSPRVEGDSLRGTWPNSLVRSVALADVATVQVKRTSMAKTVGLVLASVAVAWGVLLTVAVFSGN
jgi:curli biogenesis system outer membrane secretion channel CsgG